MLRIIGRRTGAGTRLQIIVILLLTVIRLLAIPVGLTVAIIPLWLPVIILSRTIIEIMTCLGDGSVALLFQLIDPFIPFGFRQGLIVLYILDLSFIITLDAIDLLVQLSRHRPASIVIWGIIRCIPGAIPAGIITIAETPAKAKAVTKPPAIAEPHAHIGPGIIGVAIITAVESSTGITTVA